MCEVRREGPKRNQTPTKGNIAPLLRATVLGGWRETSSGAARRKNAPRARGEPRAQAGKTPLGGGGKRAGDDGWLVLARGGDRDGRKVKPCACDAVTRLITAYIFVKANGLTIK